MKPGELRTFKVDEGWFYISLGNGVNFKDGEVVLLVRYRTARNPWGHTAAGWDVLSDGRVVFVGETIIENHTHETR